MRRSLSFLLACALTMMSFAQTQQGIVKTRGRMVNGQLVAGQKLKGATVKLNYGNPLVSGSNGAFSFNVPSGKSYSLVAATKQGYTLADPEYTQRSFKYSASTPFYVVLEDEAQRQADINAATRKVRKTLTAQLEKREEEIEALKAQSKITEKEYQERLQQLYDNQSKTEQLVKEMAERYASTDYDQLDEFNRQVQMYIEEGELQKADSLIRSKGNIEQRVEEYHSVVAANKKEREELELRESALKQSKKRLQQSEMTESRIYDDLKQDLYRRREIFVQQHKPDSALYCMKMLADLDTTNISITYDYANSSYYRLQYNEALNYAQITLRNAEAQYDRRIIAITENLLGNIYLAFNRYDESKEMYLQCLTHLELLLSMYPGTYYRQLRTMPIFNLAMIYYNQGNLEKAEEYYLKSLSEHKELIRENYDSYIWAYVWTEDRVGNFYTDIRKYDAAKEHLETALSIISDYITFPLGVERNLSLYAQVEDRMGWLYYLIGDHVNSILHYITASQYFEILYDNDPIIYLDNLARIYFYMVMSYGNLQDVENYDIYLEKAIKLYAQLYESHPSKYKSDLVNLYSRKSLRLSIKQKEAEAFELATLACAIDESDDLARMCLAECYNRKALECVKESDFDRAYSYIDKATTILPTFANLYDTKGKFLLMQGKTEEALMMWKKVLELEPDFLKYNPEGTELSNGLKKLGLIE